MFRYIDKPGWFLTKNGTRVVVQHWDHNFQPYKGAKWRAMLVLDVEHHSIRDYKCIWYTVHGEGWFSDSTVNLGDYDIKRSLELKEIPACHPITWMPEIERGKYEIVEGNCRYLAVDERIAG